MISRLGGGAAPGVDREARSGVPMPEVIPRLAPDLARARRLL